MTGPIIETPRGSIFAEGPNSARLEWNTARFGGGGTGGNGTWQGQFSNAQKFLDSEILRGTEKYIPLLTGVLIKSGILGTEVGSGTVQWIAPYAKAQYYSPRQPGSLTGPLRGPFWFERWKQVDGEKTLNKAKSIAGGNG